MPYKPDDDQPPSMKFLIEKYGAVAEEKFAGRRALISETDRRIARSTRLSLVMLGYRGERLKEMQKKLRGNAELNELIKAKKRERKHEG